MAEADPVDLWASLDAAWQPVPTCPSCGCTRCRTCGRSVTRDFTTPSKHRQERSTDLDQIDSVILWDEWVVMNNFDPVNHRYLKDEDR